MAIALSPRTHFFTVRPAKAGIQGKRRGPWPWIPAFAGMTKLQCDSPVAELP